MLLNSMFIRLAMSGTLGPKIINHNPIVSVTAAIVKQQQNIQSVNQQRQTKYVNVYTYVVVGSGPMLVLLAALQCYKNLDIEILRLCLSCANMHRFRI
jgi:hypothetical protein